MVMKGVASVTLNKYSSHDNAVKEIAEFSNRIQQDGLDNLKQLPLIIICDDAEFTAKTINNFVWVTFTRSNPSKDIHGVQSFTENKHWGCNGPLIIDARIKPHHAPILEKDPSVEKRIDRLFAKGGSLAGLK